jgi:translation elongation factor EF-4
VNDGKGGLGQGKKRMKNVGSVEVLQKAFLAVLELDD